MKKKSFIILVIIVTFVITGCGVKKQENQLDTLKEKEEDIVERKAIDFPEKKTEVKSEVKKTSNRIELSRQSSIFRFSAEIPAGFEIEYVPQIESINIYDPKAFGETLRDKSQIFIRYFKASKFLTLSTVDIHDQEETKINDHDAVRYEIEKKAGVAAFPYQPDWRNERHKLVDIRFSPESPTTFYVFSYNPDFGEKKFDTFINSLVMHSDSVSLKEPLTMARSRIIKKPFGIYITPENSPVTPEKFTGYHAGVDYEVFESEREIDVPAQAVCGGELLQKSRVSGYGGLAIQKCVMDGEPVMVYYGHLNLSSIEKSPGDYLVSGETLGLLGKGESAETDNERKHLHLGITKGNKVDIRGYIQNESELKNWINFSEVD